MALESSILSIRSSLKTWQPLPRSSIPAHQRTSSAHFPVRERKLTFDVHRLDKVLLINEYTGIDTRSSIGTIDHPLVNGKDPPTIAELCESFLDAGVKLSVTACRKAIEQWGGDLSEITHMVSTTCTNSANPGFDHFVVKALGLNTSIEKALLHGVGCSGGLAALRTAANIALGSSFRRKPARILVLACEISTTFVRSELQSIHDDEEVRIGVALFSDCASAVVLGNGFSDQNLCFLSLILCKWNKSEESITPIQISWPS